MGSIVEAAIYEFISKFFLIFVIVPAGIIFRVFNLHYCGGD